MSKVPISFSSVDEAKYRSFNGTFVSSIYLSLFFSLSFSSLFHSLPFLYSLPCPKPLHSLPFIVFPSLLFRALNHFIPFPSFYRFPFPSLPCLNHFIPIPSLDRLPFPYLLPLFPPLHLWFGFCIDFSFPPISYKFIFIIILNAFLIE